MPRTWDDVLNHYYAERKAGRDGYAGSTFQSRAEIHAAYRAIILAQSEWTVGDTIETCCGARGYWIKGDGCRAFGVIVTLPNERDAVEIKWADGVIGYRDANTCKVKREAHHEPAS